ncbi:hypothetical protein JYU34_012921 [Plutella xylostella]|uniref:Uncharacterized protein n=1 Tax=Plutella xylostella TaxID=51655 RepID=A0ABQ7QDG6_PLUXY|nr:hypothetical protein JYU34_012921 [Plutella xylostella]
MHNHVKGPVEFLAMARRRARDCGPRIVIQTGADPPSPFWEVDPVRGCRGHSSRSSQKPRALARGQYRTQSRSFFL